MIMYLSCSDSSNLLGMPPSPEHIRTGMSHFSLRYAVATAMASQALVDSAPMLISLNMAGYTQFTVGVRSVSTRLEPSTRKGLLGLWDHAWKHRRSVEDIFDRDEGEGDEDEGEGDEHVY